MAKTPSKKPALTDVKSLTTLIESVKKDNLLQYGEIKKDLGGFIIQLDQHHRRLSVLEKDKIERDAIDKYKKLHPEVAKEAYNAQRKAADEDNGTVTINKALLTALKYLMGALAAMAAALLAMKASSS